MNTTYKIFGYIGIILNILDYMEYWDEESHEVTRLSSDDNTDMRYYTYIKWLYRL